jgi:hypothetical protein
MAGFFIPDPRFEMPSLFDPGRKPVGNVVIDPSHWMSKDLSFEAIYQTGKNYLQVLTGQSLTKTGNIVQGVGFIKGSSFGTNYLQATGLKINGDYTITTTLRPTLSNGDFHLTFGSTNISIISGFQANKFNFFAGGYPTGSSSASEVPMEVGILSTVSFVVNNGVFYAYVNGVLESTGAITTANFTTVNDGNITIDGTSTGAGGNNAEHHNTFLHNRALTSAEVRSLYNSLYQNIIPA